MNTLRKNADLFFINYKRKQNYAFVFPLILMVIALVSAVLFFFEILPFSITPIFIYVIAGAGGVLLVITIVVAASNQDKTIIPTSTQIASLLAQDIASVKTVVSAQLSPDFAPGISNEIVVVNQCSESVLGFRPYTKKAADNKTYCSLNKISVFSFGTSKLQIHTQIVDTITGIDILQKTTKIPYSEIVNCYIAYDSSMLEDSVKFQDNAVLNNNKLLPQLVSAVKSCKEILRICVRNAAYNSPACYDILVANYQLYYTKSGLYKNIITINDGKALEKELLTRIGRLDRDIEQTGKESTETAYNFIDSVDDMKGTPLTSKWN